VPVTIIMVVRGRTFWFETVAKRYWSSAGTLAGSRGGATLFLAEGTDNRTSVGVSGVRHGARFSGAGAIFQSICSRWKKIGSRKKMF